MKDGVGAELSNKMSRSCSSSIVFFLGFDEATYKKTLDEVFGSQSEYEFTGDGSKPIKAPWRNGSIKQFLSNFKEGKDKTGADDKQVSDKLTPGLTFRIHA